MRSRGSASAAGAVALSVMAVTFLPATGAAADPAYDGPPGAAKTTGHFLDIYAPPTSALMPTGDTAVAASLSGGTATFGGTTVTSDSGAIVVARLSKTGSWTWATQTTGTGRRTVTARDVAVDKVGNVYVTGGFTGKVTFGSTTLDGAYATMTTYVAKLTAAGAWVWAVRLVGSGAAGGRAIGLDPGGRPVVLSDGGGTRIIRLWTTGKVRSVLKLPYSGNATSLVVDPADNVYLAGSYSGTVRFGAFTLRSFVSDPELQDFDAYVAKLSKTNHWVWAATSHDYADEEDVQLSRGANGRLVLVGTLYGGSARFGTHVVPHDAANSAVDIFAAGLSPAGTWVWGAAAGGAGYELARDVAVAADGSAVVTGYLQQTASFGTITLPPKQRSAAFVAKVSSTGTWLWATAAGGDDANGGISIGSAVQFLADDRVQVTAETSGPALGDPTTLWITRLTADGTWSASPFA